MSNLTSKLLIRIYQIINLILITQNSVKRTNILTNLIIQKFYHFYFKFVLNNIFLIFKLTAYILEILYHAAFKFLQIIYYRK